MDSKMRILLLIILLLFSGESVSSGEDLLIRLYASYFESNYSNESQISDFNLKFSPSISLENYLLKWFRYTHHSNSASPVHLILSATVYLKRLKNIKITPLTIHKLSLVALVIATKFHSDFLFENKIYAKAGGLSSTELNRLEVIFLKDLGYRLFINKDDLFNSQRLLLTR